MGVGGAGDSAVVSYQGRLWGTLQTQELRVCWACSASTSLCRLVTSAWSCGCGRGCSCDSRGAGVIVVEVVVAIATGETRAAGLRLQRGHHVIRLQEGEEAGVACCQSCGWRMTDASYCWKAGLQGIKDQRLWQGCNQGTVVQALAAYWQLLQVWCLCLTLHMAYRGKHRSMDAYRLPGRALSVAPVPCQCALQNISWRDKPSRTRARSLPQAPRQPHHPCFDSHTCI